MKLVLLAATLLANTVIYTGPDPGLVILRAGRCPQGARVSCGRIWVETKAGKPDWIALNIFKAHLDQEHHLVRSDPPEVSEHVGNGNEFTVDMSDGSPRLLMMACDFCAPVEILLEPGNARIEFVLKREAGPSQRHD